VELSGLSPWATIVTRGLRPEQGKAVRAMAAVGITRKSA
jgi:hypothetical protein